MLPLKVRISGLGSYLPPRVVTSAELEERCGLEAGWVERHNGVVERRWAGGETAAEMAAHAAREALHSADVEPGSVDLILSASGTQQQPIPDNAPLVQRALGLGASGIACMSVHTTCLGFLHGLDAASSLIATGRYRRVLLVCADIASAGLDFGDPETATLLGDGAGAAVLEPARAGDASAVLALRFETYGDGAPLTEIRGGGTGLHPSSPDARPADFLFRMAGREVLRMARKHLPGFLERLQPGLSRELGAVGLVVPHQTSRVGMRLLESFGWPPGRIVRTLHRTGNCVSASLPLTLHDAVRSGQLARGDRVLLVGSGAGLSFGAAILTY